jgi:NDP-sugar pyrophosphorylase family protein
MEENWITDFEHRPLLDVWVNAGHYVFSKEIVTKYFPDEGDFEPRAMREIAKAKHLKGLKYQGEWLTLNTMKDLIRIREYFEGIKQPSSK